MQPDAPTPRLLRIREVSQLTSLGHSAIYARVSRGDFPQPLAISSRCTVWIESEVVAWIKKLPRGVGPRPGSPAASAA
jgi:prophage regulatory protein